MSLAILDKYWHTWWKFPDENTRKHSICNLILYARINVQLRNQQLFRFVFQARCFVSSSKADGAWSLYREFISSYFRQSCSLTLSASCSFFSRFFIERKSKKRGMPPRPGRGNERRGWGGTKRVNEGTKARARRVRADATIWWILRGSPVSTRPSADQYTSAHTPRHTRDTRMSRIVRTVTRVTLCERVNVHKRLCTRPSGPGRIQQRRNSIRNTGTRGEAAYAKGTSRNLRSSRSHFRFRLLFYGK